MFFEWQEFYVLEPFGPWRDNYHAALIAQQLATAFGNPRRARPSAADFMYKDVETSAAEDDAVFIAKLNARKGDNA